MTTETKNPKKYPVLRNLQFSPLKDEEEKYVVLWDPTGLTSEKLVVPLNYFFLLQYFDGEHSLEEIGAEYLRRFGEFFMPDRLERLVEDLDAKLFLEGDKVEAAKARAREAYRKGSVRPAAFAGKSYEADTEKLTAQLEEFFRSPEGPPVKASENRGKPIKGLVVPHYEVRMGGPVYAWAYKELREAETPDLYVVVGTCHAGLEHGFALTDKDFETPLGRLPVDQDVVARLRKQTGEVLFEEEISHRVEHSIEFQVPFLQHLVGRNKPITFVPILSAFPPSCLFDPKLQGLGDTVKRSLDALREALARAGRPFCVVASADLAHIGMRYGDSASPSDFAFHRCMQSDLQMLKHVEELNPEAFAGFIHQEGDQRRICGFSPIYTLLNLIQAEKGEVLRYDRGITDQFNSTVTFASMAFF